MDTEELVAATETLDADEIAELAPDLPQEVMDDVFQSLPVEEREQLARGDVVRRGHGRRAGWTSTTCRCAPT